MRGGGGQSQTQEMTDRQLKKDSCSKSTNYRRNDKKRLKIKKKAIKRKIERTQQRSELSQAFFRCQSEKISDRRAKFLVHANNLASSSRGKRIFQTREGGGLEEEGEGEGEGGGWRRRCRRGAWWGGEKG